MRLLQPFNVAADGVFGHSAGVFEALALRHESGQGGHNNCIAAVLVGFAKRRVLVDSVFPHSQTVTRSWG
jgi:hypothetical protein